MSHQHNKALHAVGGKSNYEMPSPLQQPEKKNTCILKGLNFLIY